MKIVVGGGTGLMRSKVVARLRGGHDVLAAAKAVGDPREVVSDPEARYYGSRVEERSLVRLGEARLGRIGLDEWLRRSRAAA